MDGGENGAIRYSRYNRYLHKQVDERPEFERSVTAVTTVTSTSRCTSAPNLSEPRKKKRRRGNDPSSGGGGDGDGGMPPIDPELLAVMGFGAFGR